MALGANEKLSYRSPKSFHISQATLDINSLNSDDSECITQLWIRKHSQKILLATVSRTILQWKLDLAFEANEKARFYTVGTSTIYLSGYIIPESSDDDSTNEVTFTYEPANC